MKVEPSQSVDPLAVLAKIRDAWDFCQLFFPDLQPYRWQIEELLRLSGFEDPYDETSKREATVQTPLQYTLCAANGSGKDQIVLAVWALYCVCCKPYFHWIGTSSSYTQLHEQTWRHIEERAKMVNAGLHPKFLKINKHKIRCTVTKSEITMFRTDEGGKTEGWHPLKAGFGMAIVLNECKSLEHELVLSFKRCHGYTHWVNISSPGDPQGYFYDKCTRPDHVYPQRMVMGQAYFRRVDYTQCPHLFHEFERDVKEFGLESPYIQSSYLAQFCVTNQLHIISPERITYKYPAPASFGMPRRAGLDLALGGDAVVLSIWEGNEFIKELEFFERHEPTLTRLLIGVIEQERLAPAQVYADAGGTGTPIIQRMHDEGCPVNGILNQAAARNRRVFWNRGAELAWNFRMLVYNQTLNLERASAKLKRQMGMRYYKIKDGKILLESKADFRARAAFSPDHFDAAILANAGLNQYIFNEAGASNTSEETKRKLPNSFWADWNSIYGDIDDTTARAGAYRSGGFFGQRSIGAKVQGITDRLGKARNGLAHESGRV